VFKGDASFVRVLDFVTRPGVIGFTVLIPLSTDTAGLLGEGDREEDWDLDFVGGSLEDRGNE